MPKQQLPDTITLEWRALIKIVGVVITVVGIYYSNVYARQSVADDLRHQIEINRIQQESVNRDLQSRINLVSDEKIDRLNERLNSLSKVVDEQGAFLRSQTDMNRNILNELQNRSSRR